MYNRVAQIVFCGLLLAGVQPGVTLAENSGTKLKAVVETYVEKYTNQVDVAGQLRAGLMYGSVSGKVNVSKLAIDLDAAEASKGGRVCMRVASRNGAFSATWEITLGESGEQPVYVEFPTDHRADLEAFAVDELVVIASLKSPTDGCADSQRLYLPTSWGEADKSSLTAYLNADSTEAVIAGKAGEAIKNEPCRILPSTDTNTAYDTICTLNLTLFKTDADEEPPRLSELVVLRKHFATVMKKIRYRLAAD